MASMEKAAAGWSIAIVAIFVALAAAGDSVQSTSAPIAVPSAPPAVVEQPVEAETMIEEGLMIEEAMTEEEAMAEGGAMVEEAMTEEEAMAEGGAMVEEAMTEEEAMAEGEAMVEEAMTEEEATTEPTEPQTVTVEIPIDTALPGCEITDACYIPGSVTINVGDTVAWDNADIAAHTVTSGSPQTGPSGEFDSSLIIGGAIFEVTFDEAGSYEYFCLVHPWMLGAVDVS